MADFQNLLGEIDPIQNDENSNLLDDNDIGNDGVDIGNNHNNQRPQRISIPDVLREAEIQHKLAMEQVTDRDAEDEIEDAEITGDALFPDEDYETLKRLWIHEINVTELLQNDDERLLTLIELLPSQEANIEEFTEQAQQQSGGHGNVDANLASLASSICKMDFDRMCFLLADLKRTRLGKIEKYALHNREITERMSDQEVRQYNCSFCTFVKKRTIQIPANQIQSS